MAMVALERVLPAAEQQRHARARSCTTATQTDEALLKRLIEEHHRRTGSARARETPRQLGASRAQVRQGLPDRVQARAGRDARARELPKRPRSGHDDRAARDEDARVAAPTQTLAATRRQRDTMGKVTGFLEFERLEEGYEPVAERVKHYKEFVIAPGRRRGQGAGRALHGLRHAVLQQRLPGQQHHPGLQRPGLPRRLEERHRGAATRPTTSPSSPAASARRRAKRRAR